MYYGPLNRQIKRIRKKTKKTEAFFKTRAYSFLDRKEMDKRLAIFSQVVKSNENKHLFGEGA